MDRFSEELFGIRRNYETFSAPDEPIVKCECGRKVPESEMCGILCRECAAVCEHDNVRVQQWDNGQCSETGYYDAGMLYKCLDCDGVFEPQELERALFALQGAGCFECGSTRKTVESDRLYVNSLAVCCGEVA